MKKLMIVTHKMSGGGCERVIAQLLGCYARDGIECKLVTECGVPSFYDLPESVEQIYLTFVVPVGHHPADLGFDRLGVATHHVTA